MLCTSNKRKKNPQNVTAVGFSREQKNIEAELRKAYYLNRTQKKIFTIINWAVNKNKKENNISYAQISVRIINNIMKRDRKAKKEYHKSTISRAISVLRSFNMIESERGKDKINRYRINSTEKWHQKSTENRIEKSTENQYELFTETVNECTDRAFAKKEPLVKDYIYNNIYINSKIDKNQKAKSTDRSGNFELEEKCKDYIDYLKRVKKRSIENESAYLRSMMRLAVNRAWDFSDYEIYKQQASKLKQRELANRMDIESIERQKRRAEAEKRKWQERALDLKRHHPEEYENYKKDLESQFGYLRGKSRIIELMIPSLIQKREIDKKIPIS